MILHKSFLISHLENKVSLERESNDGPPIAIQYSRRKTSGIARAQVMELEEVFKNWAALKERMLVQFRSIREGTLVGRFFSIKQKTNVEEYRNRFDRYLALVEFLQTV